MDFEMPLTQVMSPSRSPIVRYSVAQWSPVGKCPKLRQIPNGVKIKNAFEHNPPVVQLIPNLNLQLNSKQSTYPQTKWDEMHCINGSSHMGPCQPLADGVSNKNMALGALDRTCIVAHNVAFTPALLRLCVPLNCDISSWKRATERPSSDIAKYMGSLDSLWHSAELYLTSCSWGLNHLPEGCET